MRFQLADAPKTKVKYNLHEDLFTDVFYKILDTETRFIINYGGTASGKSHAQAQLEVIRSLQNKERILIIRKTGATLKDSVIPLIKAKIQQFSENPPNPLASEFKENISNREIRNLRNGSMFLFRGLDDPEKLKSIEGITRIWIEEANELEFEDFLEINRRVRGVDNIQISLTFNPIIESHWIKSHFFDEQLNNTTIVKSTWKDNRFLKAEDIEQIERLNKVDENQYRIYALGEWGKVTTGQEFYSTFKRMRHTRKVGILNDHPIHISFDQNVIPYISMGCFQVCKIESIDFPEGYYWELRQFDEFALEHPKNNTEILCREFFLKYEKYLTNGLYYYGDATGRKRDTRSRENDYDIVERVLGKYLNNTSCRVPYSNPSVSKRRDFIIRLFGEYFNIRILIDENCKKTIEDFENVKEDIDGSKLKKKFHDKKLDITYEKWGHMTDLFDYLICEIFKGYYK
jgi:hypothetical protein